MPSVKFGPPLAVAYELQQRALKEGRSQGETILRLVQSALAASKPIEIEDGKIDKIERNTRGKATAAWLSPPIATAIQNLAQEHGRSQSWVVRDLLRCELRRRGAMPTPAGAPPIPA